MVASTLPAAVTGPVFSNAFLVRCIQRFDQADWDISGFLSPAELLPIVCEMIPAHLRVNVTVGTGAACASPSAQWSYDAATGFIRSGIASAGPAPQTADPWRWGASPLCIAARSEGAFNTAS